MLVRGLQENIVSKQTSPNCNRYNSYYTTGKHHNYTLFCTCTLFYTVATHINYIGIHSTRHRIYVYRAERDQKTIPCDFYFILAGGWQFVYIGGNFSNPVSVTIPDGGSPERPSSACLFFLSRSLRFDKRLGSDVKCC